ncbi:LEA type 2 family protein [Halomicrococcus sp. NG-SE-24]|uniref:LEA type 2 family protein n=1 Tax=Halomicrococcus sp. NG-SE-24 TaxID=3436928 RepID=UPI003D96F2C1
MVLEKLKATLSTGKRGLVLAVLLLVAVLAAGFLTGVLGAPKVAGVDNEFGNVSAETTEIETALVVNNPNPVGIRLGKTSVNYTVAMNGVALARGNETGLGLEKGNTTLRFGTAMNNERIPAWWVTHIRNDEETTLKIHSTVRSSLLGRSVDVPYQQPVKTDIIGQFNSTETRPVNANATLVSDPVLYVNETSANWGTVTESETPIRMQMQVYNPKSVPYTVTEIGYRVTMNDVPVGKGTTKRPYAIPPESAKTVKMKTRIQNEELDEWWVSHLRNNQVTDLKIKFYARIELPSGQTIRVPLRNLTYEKRIETNIFGNDSAEGTLGPSAGANGTSTVTTTDGEETTGTDGTTTKSEGTTIGGDGATTAGDETTGASTTAEGTTTDDGLLALEPTDVAS